MKLRNNYHYLWYTFLTLLLLTKSSFSNVERPDYCSNYPNFHGNSNTNNSSNKNSSYSLCIDGRNLEVDISQATSAIAKIQEYTADTMGAQLQRRLNDNALLSILEKRKTYLGIHPKLDSEISNELDKCSLKRSEHRSEDYSPEVFKAIEDHKGDIAKVKFNEDKQKDVILLNIINAVKANALLEEGKNYRPQIDMANEKVEAMANNCFKAQRECKDEVGFFGSAKECREERKLCDEKTEQERLKQDNIIDELNKSVSPLYSLVQTSPTLFDSSNDGNIFAVFQTDELQPSPLLKEITKYIPKELITEMKGLIATNDRDKLDTFYSNHSEALNKLVEDKEIFKKITRASKNEINDELEKLDDAAIRLCQGEGENLHHYPALVAKTMDDMFQNAPEGMLDRRIVITQMAYCHLLSSEPIENSGISFSSISGFSMLGAGLIMQVVPVAGTAVGTGLMVAGGAILTAQGYKDLYESNSKLTKDKGLHSAGLLGYDKLLQSKSDRNTNLAWSVADTILLPLDLHALRTLKGGGGKVASVNVTRVNKTTDIKDHKDGTFFERLLSNVPGVGPSVKSAGLVDQFKEIKNLDNVSSSISKTKSSINNIESGKIVKGLREEDDIPVEIVRLLEKSLTDQRVGSLKGLTSDQIKVVHEIRESFPDAQSALDKIKALQKMRVRTDKNGLSYFTGVPEKIHEPADYTLVYKGTAYADKVIISKSQIGKSADDIPRGDKEFMSFSEGQQHGKVELPHGISVSTDPSIATYYGTDVVVYKIPNEVFKKLPTGDPTLAEKVFKYMIPDEYRVMTMDKETMIRYNKLNKE